MLFFPLLSFLALFLNSKSLEPQDFPKEKNQLLLTSETFPLALQTFPYLLVFFYKENDDKCDEFYQFFHKITSSDSEEQLVFSSIDIEEEHELLDNREYEISQDVPKVIFYISGKPITYDGGPSIFFMRRWVTKRMQPKSRGIGSIDDLDYFLKYFSPNQIKFIFVGANQASAQMFLDYTIFLKRWEHMPAGHVMPKFGEVYQEVVSRYMPEKIKIDQENDNQSAVLIFRGKQFETNFTVIYNTSFWNLVDEYEKIGIPKVWFYDEFAKQHFFFNNYTFLILLTDKNCTEKDNYEAMLQSLQKKYSTNLLFSIGEYEQNHDVLNLVSSLNIPNLQQTTLFIINPMGRFENYNAWQKYKFDETQEINNNTVEQFIQKFVEKKLEKYYKSEVLEFEPPLSVAAQLPPHSIRLSAKYFGNFFAEFLPTHHILALFLLDQYCPYSKHLLPIYQAIAEILHKKLGNNLVCIAYNPTANELKDEMQ